MTPFQYYACMFPRMILTLCAGLIAVSPAFALSTKSESNAGTVPSYKSNSIPETKIAPETISASEDATAAVAREHLTKLWEATLCHSTDVQFVIQKLMGKNSSVLKFQKALNHFSQGAGTWAMADLDDPGYPKELVPVSDCVDPRFTSSGYSCLRRLWGGNGQRPSQTETIMLFDMVLRAANTLSSSYSDYTSTPSQLKSDTDKSKIGLDSDLQKKLMASRQTLVDLAGRRAVDELDKELEKQTKTETNL